MAGKHDGLLPTSQWAATHWIGAGLHWETAQMVKSAIRHWLEARRLDMKTWSVRAGLGETAVRDILERDRDPRFGTLQRLAEALDMTVGELLRISPSPAMVPVVGYVGAGAEVFPFDDHEKGAGMDEIPAPAGLEDAVAVIVRSDSMYPVYRDGDLLFYRRDPFGRGTPQSAIGEECIVQCHEGPMLIKVLRRGTTRATWTLESYNAPPRNDVKVDWAAPVLFVDRRGRFRKAT